MATAGEEALAQAERIVAELAGAVKVTGRELRTIANFVALPGPDSRMTLAEAEAALERATGVLQRDLAKLRQEVEYRPAYAPADRLTRTEAGSAALVRRGVAIVLYYRTLRNCLRDGRDFAARLRS